MLKRNLVGLCGLAGSGKDALAALLRMKGYYRLAFGDGVRDEVVECIETRKSYLDPGMPKELWLLLHPSGNFGDTPVPVEEVWAKPTSPRMRTILQLWGTEFRRGQDPNYWISKAMQKLAMLRMKSGNFSLPVVVTDVRFPEEAAVIRDRGGEIWKVERPGLSADSHVSEKNVETLVVERILVNDGSLLDLANKVLPWLDS